MAELHLPHQPHAQTDNPEVRHEETDVNIRAILRFAGGLVVVALVVHVLVWLLFQYFTARETRTGPLEYPMAAAQRLRVPPEPRLQTNPRQDLADLLAREDEALTTYGWVDRNAGIVRIPIEEAMKLVVQRGLPTREGNR